jgi:putative membrane protein
MRSVLTATKVFSLQTCQEKTMKKRNLLYSLSAFCAVLLAAASLSWAAAVSTEDFVHVVSITNKFEIDSSRLALEKSVNPDVKKFAQTMINDHIKAGAGLKAALGMSKTEAKIEEDLDAAHQNLLDSLKASASDSFDGKYIAMQTDAHKEAVSLFSGYAMNGSDAALKKFAEDTLPVLKSHLEHALKLKASNGA